MAPTNPSYQGYVDYLKTGYWLWSQGRDHKLPDLDVTVDLGGLAGNPAQMDAARLALQQWSSVVPVMFRDAAADADIIFVNLAPGAFFSQTSRILNIGQDFWGGDFRPGGYGFQAFLHEIGHALGLGHGGPYNTGGTYQDNAIFTKDCWPYSVMSYFSGEDARLGPFAYMTTPAAADIAAILQKYPAPGAAPAMNTGDDVYGFGGKPGYRLDNGGLAHAGFAIHDTGGYDILDLSGSPYIARIDLRPGAFTSAHGRGANIYIHPGADPSPIEEARGGNQNDWIFGSVGANTMIGNAGDDALRGGPGADRLFGGDGRDQANYETSLAGVAIDLDQATATGGDAAGDRLDGIETLVGSAYADRLIGDDGRNGLYGGGGDDLLVDGAGNDRLAGGDGSDRAEGGAGNDSIDGHAGDDTLLGGSDHDTLFGGSGADTLDGGAGNDLLDGGEGADLLRGGDGTDSATYAAATAGVSASLATGRGTAGEAAGDRFEGIERLLGSLHADTLSGDAGANLLAGSHGDDVLAGGGGADILTGGGHADRFVYLSAADSTAAAAGRDIITDFWSGEGDRIDLRTIDADGRTTNGDTAFRFVSHGFTGAGAEIQAVPAGALHTMLLLADIDGDRQADFAIRVFVVQDLGAAELLL